MERPSAARRSDVLDRATTTLADAVERIDATFTKRYWRTDDYVALSRATPQGREIEAEVMKKINAGELDKRSPAAARRKLTLIEGARDQGQEAPATREDSPAAKSEPTTNHAHAGAIARAMKGNPGLTYEEALAMAEDLGF